MSHLVRHSMLLLMIFTCSPATFGQEKWSNPLHQCVSGHSPDNALSALFERLSTEVHSSQFVVNGKAVSYGAAPLCLFTDVSSLKNWPVTITPVPAVQLVQVKIATIAESQQIIDLSRFSEYPQLLFIHVLSEVDLTKATLLHNLKNVPPNAIVIFTVDKPS